MPTQIALLATVSSNAMLSIPMTSYPDGLFPQISARGRLAVSAREAVQQALQKRDDHEVDGSPGPVRKGVGPGEGGEAEVGGGEAAAACQHCSEYLTRCKKGSSHRAGQKGRCQANLHVPAYVQRPDRGKGQHEHYHVCDYVGQTAPAEKHVDVDAFAMWDVRRVFVPVEGDRSALQQFCNHIGESGGDD
ncbi:MAG: hypothetical protein MMC23_001091 [Stictis urceolatum]|nr:hypothetical protein [Stictis urceolata]